MRNTNYLQHFTLIVGLSLFSYLPLAQEATDESPAPKKVVTTKPPASGTDCAKVKEISEAECNALLEFYKSTNSTQWDSTDWNKTDTPCSWTGVKCEGNSVRELNLQNNQLISKFTPESLSNLSNLSKLETLDLSYNELSGSIPESLGNLKQLVKLYLYRNQLSGPIPESLGELSNLEILYLSHNQLEGPIPDSLGQLKKLKTLVLSQNQLEGSIPDSLGMLSNLKLFHVNGNKLCGNLPKLLENLGQINIDIDPPEKSCPKFCATTTGIQEAECEALISFYTSTNGANWKNRSNWNKTKTPCDDWTGVECDSGYVTSLKLSGNKLNGSIPESLSKLEKLEKLKILNLSQNQLRGSISESLGNMSSLEEINLSDNQISGSIPESLGKLEKLETLNLSQNQLRGSIPESLGNKLSSLKEMALNNNQISGSIPESLGQLKELKTLNLSYNQLSGSIPESLGNLKNLTALLMTSNSLSDVIPAELNRLSNLKYLYLNKNELSGSIPDLSSLENVLIHLYLDSNYLSDSIPKSLVELKNLERLHLQDNQLNGDIPGPLGNLKNLKYLYLNNNRLCGNIPKSLMKLNIAPSAQPDAESLISGKKEIFLSISISDNYLTTSNRKLIAWLYERDPRWEENQGKHCPKEAKQRDCSKDADQSHPACRRIATSQSHYCKYRDKYLDILDSGSLGLMCFELADWQKKAKDIALKQKILNESQTANAEKAEAEIALKQKIRDEFQTAVGGWLAQTKREVQEAGLITDWSQLQKFHSLENVCIKLSKWQGWLDNSISSTELQSKVRGGLRKTVTESLYKWKLKVEEELHQCIKYSALVIGISDYSDNTGGFKNLKTPATDARNIALVLRYDYGFEVTTLLDEEATKSNIQAAYQRLLSDATENEYILIFYAGHGIKKGGISYWVPTDAKTYEKSMISLDKVAHSMCKSPAQKIFIVSDSCYFRVSGSEKSCPQGKTKKSRVALSSGNLFEQVLDSDPSERGGPSPFAKIFLKGLIEPPVEDYFTHYKTFRTDRFFYEYFINTKFSRMHGQHPQYYKIPEAGHEAGDFMFQSVFLSEHHKHQMKPMW